jgi:hypothetical protein
MTPGLTLTGRVDLAGAKLTRAEARDWLARAAVWFETVGDVVLDAQLACDDGQPVLLITFHPAADDVEIRLSSAGMVRLTGATAPAGPGYHAYLCEVAAAFAEDFDIVWEQVEDATGFFRSGDRAALEQRFLTYLWRMCGEQPTALGLPEDHGFTYPGSVLTPTGPRSCAWLAAVAADPTAGRDFFAWWQAERDAAFYRRRAETFLWCDFPWRAPLTDDEAEITDQIAADLEMAYSLDPAAPLPWCAWAEVLAALEADGGELTVQAVDAELKRDVLRRAAMSCTLTIGYRRYPVRVPLGGGWSIEVPGLFAEEWDADGRTWHGWDGSRRVAVEFGAAGAGEPNFAETADESGRRVWRLSGVAGESLLCRIDVPSAADWGWAEAVWQSLRRVPVRPPVATGGL